MNSFYLDLGPRGRALFFFYICDLFTVYKDSLIILGPMLQVKLLIQSCKIDMQQMHHHHHPHPTIHGI